MWPCQTWAPGDAEKLAIALDFSYAPLASCVHFTHPVPMGVGSFGPCSDRALWFCIQVLKRDGMRHRVGKLVYKCSWESEIKIGDWGRLGGSAG